MRIGLTANPAIPTALDVAKRAWSRLRKAATVVPEEEIAAHLGEAGERLDTMEVDVVLAVGGDGTVLRAFQLTTAPVLGVNSGSLGFLTEVTAQEMDPFLDRIAAGDFETEDRMRLAVRVAGKPAAEAVNEIVVHTAHIAKIRSFEVLVDGDLAERVRADGVIVATPTGSTSYSMSAGGPIVDPRVGAFIVTAIAPFTPSMRPLVFPADSEIQLRLPKAKGCLLVADGQKEVALRGDEDLRFVRSERPARFVRFRHDFYRRVEEKLGRS